MWKEEAPFLAPFLVVAGQAHAGSTFGHEQNRASSHAVFEKQFSEDLKQALKCC
jgi:hypothetical protein